MKRRNYTREILAQVAAGRVAVRSVGYPAAVQYKPRSKSDPWPWYGEGFRYNGREIHTVEACAQKMLSLSGGNFTSCSKPTGHDKACAPARKDG